MPKLSEYPIATPSANDTLISLKDGAVKRFPVQSILDLSSTIFNTPSGKCKITRMYVNPLTGKLEIEYDNIPIP
jgi:hypothetical protein